MGERARFPGGLEPLERIERAAVVERHVRIGAGVALEQQVQRVPAVARHFPEHAVAGAVEPGGGLPVDFPPERGEPGMVVQTRAPRSAKSASARSASRAARRSPGSPGGFRAPADADDG
ncbi:MAG: hypothetical protein V9G22_11405 [Ottowia sp.]